MSYPQGGYNYFGAQQQQGQQQGPPSVPVFGGAYGTVGQQPGAIRRAAPSPQGQVPPEGAPQGGYYYNPNANAQPPPLAPDPMQANYYTYGAAGSSGNPPQGVASGGYATSPYAAYGQGHAQGGGGPAVPIGSASAPLHTAGGGLWGNTAAPPVVSSPPVEQHQPQQVQSQAMPQAPPEQPRLPSGIQEPQPLPREAYVEEAIQQTAEYMAKEQLRREAIAQVMGSGTAAEDALRGLSREEAEALLQHPSLQDRYTDAAAAAEASEKPTLEFVVGSPLHCKRVAVLLMASLFGMIPLLSSLAMTVLLCGVILIYISDYLGYHRGTVLVLVAAVVLFCTALLITNFHAAISSFGPMLMILDLAGVLFMAVAAALLHFRWLQETYPELICTLERLVMGATPVLALPSLLTTTTALVGSRYAPAWFFVVMCLEHYYFYSPLKSSFMFVRRRRLTSDDIAVADAAASTKGDEESTEELVPQQLNERTEAITLAILLIVLPTAVYNAFQSNWDDYVVANLLNSLGLVCGALAYLCITPSHSLWFLSPAQNNVFSQLEFDPLGLQDIIKRYRDPFLAVVLVAGMQWAAYRLMHSHYAYIFNGVDYPYNVGLLMITMNLALFVGLKMKSLLDEESHGADTKKQTFMHKRVQLMLWTMLIVVLVCILTGVPGVFFLPSILSVSSFNMFLLDRTNAGPMLSFTVFSSLLLLWWMHRTFSFVVVDLHVFGEAAVVSTPVVVVSVLWCYVLGCASFTVAFLPDKTPLTVFLFLHALQVTWVEHVLYSQKEEGVYPAILVFATSALGVFVARRLYKNGVLGISGSSFVASCYLAKIFSFLVEVTSSYYESDLIDVPYASTLLGIEITAGWWVALVAGYIVVVFEIERKKRVEPRQAHRLMYVYFFLAAVLSLLTVRNVQRSVYEFFTRSYVNAEELPHIAIGTSLAAFALLTLPFYTRQLHRYPFLQSFISISRIAAVVAVIFLVVQPTRVASEHVSAFDYELPYADKGRYASTLGLCLLLGARVLPMQKVPLVVRVVYWFAAAASLAFGITATILPVPTFSLFCCVGTFVFLAMVVVDLAHYRSLSGSESWVVYAVCICTMVGSFVVLGRVDLQRVAHGNLAVMWEMHEQGRLQLLAVITVVNLFMAFLLKFRMEGKPLLPNCVPLTDVIISQVGVICNYASLLAACTLCVLNFWGNDSEPALYVMISLFLLLLVDDDTLFFELRKGNFRYFPTTVAALGLLWTCLLYNAWTSSSTMPGRFEQIGYSLVQAAPTLPAQISFLIYLWLGRKRGGAPASVVIVTIVFNLFALLLCSKKTVQWMAIVGICGQSMRVYESQMRRGKKSTSI